MCVYSSLKTTTIVTFLSHNIFLPRPGPDQFVGIAMSGLMVQFSQISFVHLQFWLDKGGQLVENFFAMKGHDPRKPGHNE